MISKNVQLSVDIIDIKMYNVNSNTNDIKKVFNSLLKNFNHILELLITAPASASTSSIRSLFGSTSGSTCGW